MTHNHPNCIRFPGQQTGNLMQFGIEREKFRRNRESKG